MFKRIYKSYKRSFTGLSRETWLLSTVLMFNRAGTMAIPFLGIYVTQFMGGSLAQAGLIITLFGIGSIMGASLGGWLSDKIGYRLVQVVSAIGSGLLFMVIPFIPSFQLLCIHVVLLSLVAEALRPANYAAIASYAKPGTLTRSYSLNRLAINIGWAVGGTLGGLFASINYHLLFYVDGSTNILAGIAILILLSTKRKKHSAKPNIEPRPTVVLKPWQDIWFLRFIFFVMLFNTAFFLLFRLIPIFWKEQWHISEQTIGVLLGLNGLIIAIFEMVLVNRWERRNKPFMYIIVGCVFTAVAYLCLLWPSTQMYILAIAVLMVVLLTVGEMLAMPFMNSECMQRSNAYNRGLYAAGYTLSWSVAQVIGPAGGAYIADHFGYNTLWFLLVGLLLVSAIGFYSIQNKPSWQPVLRK